ncbi:MAG TPA: NAD(P)H-dependent oxidoreductase subunit E [Spirochaetia bacterium]|nr:NAD(P)H-dependent oxidoreductase subunit E [Spirochaetia bacterium]
MDDKGDLQVDLRIARGIVEEFLSTNSAAGSRLPPDLLIPLLQKLQDAYGYLPAPVLTWASDRTAIPLSRMYGVATFYAQFSLEPRGKHSIRPCRGTACHVRGGKKIIATVQAALGLEDGETGPDLAFSFETVACLGACALAPVTVVDSTYYGKMTPRRAEQMIRQLREPEGASTA